MGLDYELFWRLTPRECMAILEGNGAREQRRIDELQAQNYYLASLIAVAFHDPNNMPKPPVPARSQDMPENASSEVDDIQVRGYFMAMASKE